MGKKIIPATSLQPPTAAQLAQLHALIVETRQNVSANNTTLTSFLYSGIMMVVQALSPGHGVATKALNNFINSLGYSKEDTQNYSTIYFVLLAVCAIALYTHSRIFTSLNHWVSYFLPNGISFDLQQPQAFKIDVKLADTKTVSSMITDLSRLNDRLKQRNGWMLFYAFTYSLILPIPRMVSYNPQNRSLAMTQMALTAKLHFPGIAWRLRLPPTQNQITQIVQHGLDTQQAVAINHWCYQLWSNWRMPKQFENFLLQLTSMSLCSLWKYNKNNLTHHKTLFEFTHNARSITISAPEGDFEINSVSYLAELYRTCIDFSLVVYASIEAKIFTLPKQTILSRSVNNFRKKLLKRLQAVQESETKIAKDFKQLESLPGKNDIWDYYSIVDTKGMSSIIYFSNRNELGAIDDLASIMAEADIGNIELDQHYIQIHNARITSHKLGFIRERYSSILANQPAPNYEIPDIGFKAVSYRKTKKIVPTSEPIAITRESLPKFKFSRLRPHHFDQEILKTQNAGSFPDNFAFPLSVAWLKVNTAFASIDPQIFTALSQFCSRAEIEARLHRGTVMGARKTHHSKAGATGIIYSTDPYQTMNGTNIEAATFKIKFTNNIRIYGRKFNEINLNGTKRILYLFDGFGLGH